MAFEAFRAQSRAVPRSGRRLTVALSLAFHGALLAIAVAYSFWHVDELTPPSVRVTFLSAMPPPPPPPPPAGGGGGARRKVALKPKTPVPTKTPDIVQPRETPEDEPKETPKPDVARADGPGQKGGVIGGTTGGTTGGTIGGTLGGTIGGKIGGTIGAAGGTSPGPKFLSPTIGIGLKQEGADPPFPAFLRRPGAVYHVLSKICINPAGAVDKVLVLKGADPALDEGVTSTVKHWRFRPYLANGTPIPFCFVWNYEFRSQ